MALYVAIALILELKLSFLARIKSYLPEIRMLLAAHLYHLKLINNWGNLNSKQASKKQIFFKEKKIYPNFSFSTIKDEKSI